jgi:hypothetical protein
MVESHTDMGSTDDPTYATPNKAPPGVAPGATTPTPLGSRSNVLASGSGSFQARTQRGRGSVGRMPINRAGSMNASEYEFQQKLKSIGSDILSLDNSVSYDDADLDMGGEATYVDYEEGIEEGDELDDGQDGTSV